MEAYKVKLLYLISLKRNKPRSNENNILGKRIFKKYPTREFSIDIYKLK